MFEGRMSATINSTAILLAVAGFALGATLVAVTGFSIELPDMRAGVSAPSGAVQITDQEATSFEVSRGYLITEKLVGPSSLAGSDWSARVGYGSESSIVRGVDLVDPAVSIPDQTDFGFYPERARIPAAANQKPVDGPSSLAGSEWQTISGYGSDSLILRGVDIFDPAVEPEDLTPGL